MQWDSWRSEMLLDPTVVNLNTGSYGPLPQPVYEYVAGLRDQLAAEPMDFLVRKMPPLLWQARSRLARFLGGDPRRLIFTANVSVAINIVASSIALESPGEILLTDHEYGAMHWCWERAAARLGLTLRTFPIPLLAQTPGALVEALRAALTPRTRLLFFSHVVSATGMVLPARALCALARERGVTTVVDGAHAPAMIPVNVTEIGADFYTGNCHKWLLAPTGAGFLYLGEGSAERLQPLQVSWGWKPEPRDPDERDDFGSTPRLRFLEFEGTRDPCPWLGVPAAIDFLDRVGWEAMRARIAELAAYVRQRLDPIPALGRVTPAEPGLHGALTAYRLPPGTDLPRLRQHLWERYRIEAPVFERPEGPLIRVSTHFYNTEAEIDQLAEALGGFFSGT